MDDQFVEEKVFKFLPDVTIRKDQKEADIADNYKDNSYFQIKKLELMTDSNSKHVL